MKRSIKQLIEKWSGVLVVSSGLLIAIFFGVLIAFIFINLLF